MPQVQIIEATYPISHVGIKRVAAYVRVSSSSEDQLNSYAFQIMRYQEIEKEHDDWRLVDIYADEGITGTRLDKRKEFNRLLQDCRQGKIDLIITKSVARFARNMADCLVTMRELKAIVICGECGTPYRRITWTMKGEKRYSRNWDFIPTEGSGCYQGRNGD